MTRETYQQARQDALKRYLEQAYKDYDVAVKAKRKIIANSAKRRIEFCKKRMNERSLYGFWTEEEECVYQMLYKPLPEDDLSYISPC